MSGEATIVAGIEIPSTSPVFLTVVGFHVLVGLACVVAGAVAMLSEKRRGRHSTAGTIYYWCLSAVFATATCLAVVRWAEDRHLFLLGALSFAVASLGRTAMRRGWRGSVRLHISGMGASYVLLLTAFYVDNGKNLPLWRELPSIAYWLLPGALGIPLIVWALLRHPLLQVMRASFSPPSKPAEG
jgi:uncharacterized membrane protein